jgi:hypothetical protein
MENRAERWKTGEQGREAKSQRERSGAFLGISSSTAEHMGFLIYPAFSPYIEPMG